MRFRPLGTVAGEAMHGCPRMRTAHAYRFTLWATDEATIAATCPATVASVAQKRDTHIRVHDRIRERLCRSRLTPRFHPQKGERITLLDNANLGWRHITRCHSAQVHPHSRNLQNSSQKPRGAVRDFKIGKTTGSVRLRHSPTTRTRVTTSAGFQVRLKREMCLKKRGGDRHDRNRPPRSDLRRDPTPYYR